MAPRELPATAPFKNPREPRMCRRRRSRTVARLGPETSSLEAAFGGCANQRPQ